MSRNRTKRTHPQSMIRDDNKKVTYNTSLSTWIKHWVKKHRTLIKKCLYPIIVFFVIAIPAYYRDAIFKRLLEPKPRIVVNITKVEPLYLNKLEEVKNFHLLFQTFSGRAVIAAVQVGENDLTRLYGMTYIPKALVNPTSSKNYSISFKNVGHEVARNITVDLSSFRNIRILERDPKIKLVHCGTTPVGKACHLEIASLSRDEEISFFTLNDEFMKEQFSLKIDGKAERVFLNFMTFRVANYSSSLVVEMDGRKLEWPPINDTPVPRTYYYLKEGNSWKELLSSREH